MKKELRQAGIVEMVERRGYLAVADAAASLSVTTQTIRRDFDELIALGAIVRHRGGATPNQAGKVTHYATRRSYLGEAKRIIARRLVGLIPPGSTLFIETGTTLEAIAAFLPRLELARVVTNNVHLATALARHDSWPVEVPHGAVRASDGAILGERAVASLREYRFDMALIGAGAVAPDGTIMDYEPEDVAIARTAIACAAHSVLAVDATKFRHTAPLRLAPLAGVSALVTDAEPPAPLRRAAQRAKTAILVGEEDVTGTRHPARPPTRAARSA